MFKPGKSHDSAHITVLREECLEALAVRPEGFYVDCTTGGGGHSAAIAQRLTSGHLLALDRDPAAIAIATARLAEFAPRVTVRQASFSRLAEMIEMVHGGFVDGILADLGMSQMQLDDSARGFSFAAEQDSRLDMRMDSTQELTAATIVNRGSERELADVLYKYADERRSRRIANAIFRARPIHSTKQLAEVVSGAARGPRTPGWHQAGRHPIHPATLTFQALRILVNDEFGEIEALLEQAPKVTRTGARVVIVSFHSGEDRIVKNGFRQWQTEGLFRILTKHVVRPSDAETATNPRSRSARMRCAERN